MKNEDLTPKKQELEKLRPFSKAVDEHLRSFVTLELVCANNSFEGLSFTRRETHNILYNDQAIVGHTLHEHFQVLNYAKAFEFVEELSSNPTRNCDETDVKNIHRGIVRSLDDKNAGFYRGTPLFFQHGKKEELPDTVRVQRMMNDFGMWLYTARTLHPITLAAEAHLRLMSIQPFATGNAETSRSLMNFMLMRSGYPPALFSRREAKEYWNVLEKAIFSEDREAYDKLIYRVVNRSLDIYLKAAKEQPYDEVDQDPYFLRIGQLAKESKEPVSSLRYWTSLGLIETVGKMSSGYTLYSSETLPIIQRIKQLKEKRLTLDEIKQALLEE